MYPEGTLIEDIIRWKLDFDGYTFINTYVEAQWYDETGHYRTDKIYMLRIEETGKEGYLYFLSKKLDPPKHRIRYTDKFKNEFYLEFQNKWDINSPLDRIDFKRNLRNLVRYTTYQTNNRNSKAA